MGIEATEVTPGSGRDTEAEMTDRSRRRGWIVTTGKPTPEI